MHQRWLLPLVTFVAAAPAFAASNYRYVHKPEADVYFGHISYCELKHDALDPRVLRAEGAEAASVNLPLVPGDTLVTSAERRCEAQFDTGTVLRLDESSGLWIETILARALTTNDKLTNLHLQSGRLNVLYRDYDSQEVFQILTPNAAVKLSNAAVVDVRVAESGETVVEVKRGQAAVLYGPTAQKTHSRKLKAGERATIDIDDQLASAVSPRERGPDAFDEWNREMNERFVERHAGKSMLPKPIESFPRSVLHFAQQYGDPYGEWVWSELYGYVWRPRLSQDEGWRPYLRGRWVPISGRLFWVPEEPWGWVPYHLGLWHWDKKQGWVWLPGSAFAPAWGYWVSCDDARYFRPLNLLDWSYRYARGYRYRYVSAGNLCGLYPDWFYQEHSVKVDVAQLAQAPAAPAVQPQEGGPTPIRKVPEIPLLPLPGELERLAKKTALVEQRSDPEVRAAVERMGGAAPARLEGRMPLLEASKLAPIDSLARHDWNADVRAARNVGGHIVYSSVTNMVRCENCSRPLMSVDFAGRAGEDSPRSSGSGGSGTSDSGGSSTGAASAGSSSSSSGGGGRERIRD